MEQGEGPTEVQNELEGSEPRREAVRGGRRGIEDSLFGNGIKLISNEFNHSATQLLQGIKDSGYLTCRSNTRKFLQTLYS